MRRSSRLAAHGSAGSRFGRLDVQRGERLRFSREAREAIGVVRERLRQDLDRNVPIQLGVARAKDLTHPAFANRRGDVVNAEAGAGC